MTEDQDRSSPGIYIVLDSALAQELITINEFRSRLGFSELDGGDITIKGNRLDKMIENKSKKK